MSDAVRPREWSLRWLIVSDPALPPEQRPQGFYLSARGDSLSQDRFTLVLPNGSQQAFILDYPSNERGEEARELFQLSLRSLRGSPELASGRMLVDHAIAEISLDAIRSLEPAQRLSRLADIQALLLAKLSVDPRTYDTYFHLAGTASLLATSDLPPGEDRGEHVSRSRALVQSLSLYARDLAPGDPRTAQLERLWKQLGQR
jgi:hypothetical protein